MTKPFFLFLLLAAVAPVAAAQAQQSSLVVQAPVVLRAGHMQAQAHGAANRPDKAPSFLGGSMGLGNFFQQHLKYPDDVTVKKLTGNVLLTAIIGVDGTLSNFKVAQSLSPQCDAEALRVAAQLPAWQPATRKGVPVPVMIQLPVPFGNASNLQVMR